jgi:hypothetical protein
VVRKFGKLVCTSNLKIGSLRPVLSKAVIFACNLYSGAWRDVGRGAPCLVCSCPC